MVHQRLTFQHVLLKCLEILEKPMKMSPTRARVERRAERGHHFVSPNPENEYFEVINSNPTQNLPGTILPRPAFRFFFRSQSTTLTQALSETWPKISVFCSFTSKRVKTGRTPPEGPCGGAFGEPPSPAGGGAVVSCSDPVS